MDDFYRWYVIRTNPRQEATGAAGLVGHGVTAFFPQIRKAHLPRRGAPRSVLYAMFPSYCFARICPDDPAWPRLWSSPGLRGPLRVGDTLAVVSQAEIDAMRAKEAELLNFQSKPDAPFKSGETVRLHDGSAFAGQLVCIERLDSAARVTILLNLFGRVTRATVRSEQLEKVG